MTELAGQYDPAEHLADGAEVFAAAWCKGWELPARITVSEWADAHRVISRKAGSEPGKWRTSRVPYTREIMDCFSAHSSVREVDFMKSTQVAGTEILNNVAGYTVDHAPGPAMVLMPTLGLAELWSKQRFAPMVEDMPCLAEKVAPARSRDADNTTLLKGFPGGVLAITGANSSSGLRSMPVKVLLADEVDEYEDDLNDQGSALELAERRLSTFSRRKILRVSTPTVEGGSKIKAGHDAGDRREYLVPCPHCGAHQALDDDNLTDAGEFLCTTCRASIAEHHKTAMLVERSACTECGTVPVRLARHVHEDGSLACVDACECGEIEDPPAPAGAYWQPTALSSDPQRRSYRIWAGYSAVGLGYTWREIADMRARAKRDPDLNVTFTNTILGETYDSATMKLESTELASRVSSHWKLGQVPRGVLLITVGVDVQVNRFEVKVMGWGRGERGRLIDWVQMECDPTKPEDYDVLDGVMEKAFVNAYGMSLRPVMGAIDSGNWTHEVYAYVRRSRHPWMAVKGLSKGSKQIIHRFTEQDVRWNGRVIRNGVRLWPLGTDTAKTTLIGRLVRDEDREPEDRFFGFPADTPEDYFEQLTAEKFDERKGRWVKVKGKRNEALDCLIYAYAAALHPKVHIHKNREPEWAALEAIYEPAHIDLFAPRGEAESAQSSILPTGVHVPRETKKQTPAASAARAGWRRNW